MLYLQPCVSSYFRQELWIPSYNSKPIRDEVNTMVFFSSSYSTSEPFCQQFKISAHVSISGQQQDTHHQIQSEKIIYFGVKKIKTNISSVWNSCIIRVNSRKPEGYFLFSTMEGHSLCLFAYNMKMQYRRYSWWLTAVYYILYNCGQTLLSLEWPIMAYMLLGDIKLDVIFIIHNFGRCGECSKFPVSDNGSKSIFSASKHEYLTKKLLMPTFLKPILGPWKAVVIVRILSTSTVWV